MLKILCLVISWKDSSFLCAELVSSPTPFHSVYNWTMTLKVINKPTQHKMLGQISVLSFYWSYIYFIDTLSVPRETSSFCVKILMEILLRPELKIPTLSHHLISNYISIKPSPCTWGHILGWFSQVLISPAGGLNQSLGCCCSNRAVQVSWLGLCSTLGHLCSWYFRVVLHHCC